MTSSIDNIENAKETKTNTAVIIKNLERVNLRYKNFLFLC